MTGCQVFSLLENSGRCDRGAVRAPKVTDDIGRFDDESR
jgi:hypothetical protein